MIFLAFAYLTVLACFAYYLTKATTKTLRSRPLVIHIPERVLKISEERKGEIVHISYTYQASTGKIDNVRISETPNEP